MWIFTTHGFYSITKSREEPDKLQIRARTKQHLVNLQQALSTADGVALLGPILTTPEADYRYRIIADPATVQIVLARICDGIEYSNFKFATGRSLPTDHDYQSALHLVWSTMLGVQQTENTSRPTSRRKTH